LIKYINETTEMVDKLLEHTIHTGNETVDALMNYMVCEARKDGITIEMEGMFLKECTITSFDLCTLFYNTINNAIEACRNLIDNHTRKIQVCIKVYKHALLLMVENPICEPVDYRILEKGTTKPDKKNHGFGIQNIKDTVKRYNGNVTFIHDENKFKVEILIPEAF